MSDTNLNVSVTAQTSGFTGAMEGARVSAAEFQAALKAAGGDATAAAKAILAAADAAKLEAAAAQAAAAATQQMGQAAQTAGASAQQAAASVKDMTGAMGSGNIRAAADGLNQQASAATGAAHAHAGVTRELIVMGHEAMSGNFSRIPGSFMVLAERVHLTGIEMGAAVAGVVALGFALGHLVSNAMAAERALRGVYDAALLQGRGAAAAEAQAKSMAATMVQTGLIGSSGALKISTAIMAVGDISDQTRAKLGALGPVLNEVYGEGKAAETARKIAQTFSSTSGIEEFVRQNKILTIEQQNAFDAAVRAKDGITAETIAVDALTARLKGSQDAMAAQAKTNADRMALEMASGGLGTPAIPTDQTPSPGFSQEPLRFPDVGPKNTETDADRQRNEIEQSYLVDLNREKQLKADIATLNAKMAGETDSGARSNTQTAIDRAQQELASLQNKGQPSWIQAQDLALNQSNEAIERNATTMRAAQEGTLRNTIQFWQGVLNAGNLSAQQQQEAQLRLARAKQQLDAESLRTSTASAKEGVSEQIAALSAQQAADRDNYEAVVSLENQKLAILKSAYGEESRQYQEELRNQENMAREHENQVVQAKLEGLAKQRQVDQEGLAAFKSTQDQMVSEQQISKQQALANEIAYEAEMVAKETDALTTLLGTLTEGTDAYRKAYQEREQLAAKFVADQAKNSAQVAAADRQAAQQSAQVYMQAFSQIGSSADRTVSELVVGTTTVQKAELQLAQSIVSSVVGALMHVAEQAIATQAAQLIGIQQVVQAQQAAGQTGFAAIGQWLLQQLGLVSSTNAETIAQSKLTATGEITDAAGVAGANAYAATAAIPVVGPEMAPAAAAAAVGDVMSFNSFAVGAWDLPNDMMAQLHAGEMVVPATFAEGLRSGGNSFGGGTNTNITYAPSLTHQAAGPMSRKEAETFFAAHAPALKGAVMDGVRTGRLGGGIARGVGRPR